MNLKEFVEFVQYWRTAFMYGSHALLFIFILCGCDEDIELVSLINVNFI